MGAAEVERVLRRIGLVFILGLVLQPRISGRAILLPVAAAVMAWALGQLAPVVASATGRRDLRATLLATAVVGALGLVGWFPAVEPGGLSLVILVAFVVGVLAYLRFLGGWSERVGWDDAAHHLRRARVNLIGIAVTTVVALVAVVALADRPVAGRPDPDWWNLVAGRVVGNGWVIAFSLAIFIGWVGACVELERGAKAARAALVDLGEADAPAA